MIDKIFKSTLARFRKHYIILKRSCIIHGLIRSSTPKFKKKLKFTKPKWLIITFADNMRAVILYLYLSCLLLCGGNDLFAASHHSATNFSFTQHLEKKQLVKHRNSNHHSSLTESDDIDSDEEFHSSDELQVDNINKLFTAKLPLQKSWFLAFSAPLILKDYSKSLQIFSPFCGQSNPIYITQSVLRI
jgi:hypothetical protein